MKNPFRYGFPTVFTRSVFGVVFRIVYNRPFSRRPDMLSTFALKFNLMKNVAQIR